MPCDRGLGLTKSLPLYLYGMLAWFVCLNRVPCSRREVVHWVVPDGRLGGQKMDMAAPGPMEYHILEAENWDNPGAVTHNLCISMLDYGRPESRLST